MKGAEPGSDIFGAFVTGPRSGLFGRFVSEPGSDLFGAFVTGPGSDFFGRFVKGSYGCFLESGRQFSVSLSFLVFASPGCLTASGGSLYVGSGPTTMRSKRIRAFR